MYGRPSIEIGGPYSKPSEYTFLKTLFDCHGIVLTEDEKIAIKSDIEEGRAVLRARDPGTRRLHYYVMIQGQRVSLVYDPIDKHLVGVLEGKQICTRFPRGNYTSDEQRRESEHNERMRALRTHKTKNFKRF